MSWAFDRTTDVPWPQYCGWSETHIFCDRACALAGVAFMLGGVSTLGPETTVPTLPCTLPDETAAFWAALGFRRTYDMRRPYLYLAFRWRGIEIHYGAPPAKGTSSGDGDDP